MTHLCYSLDEAAQRLDMSETVLVRLSQYFKVPQSAYEELGYLSFKGDLLFSDQDIAFFRQVKEHLLAGESLESVKGRIHEPKAPDMPSFQDTARRVHIETLSEQKLVTPPEPRRSPAPPPTMPPEAATRPARIPIAPEEPIAGPAFVPTEPVLRNLESPEAAQQAAAENFERYRGKRRPRGPKVFEKMIREVSKSGPEKSFSTLPFLKGLKPKVNDESEAPGGPAERPARPVGLAQTREIEFERLQRQAAEVATVLNERFPWKAHLEAVRQHPRVLDERLQKAARLIREQATG